eukprot:6456194-Amphidinium_carterae.1
MSSSSHHDNQSFVLHLRNGQQLAHLDAVRKKLANYLHVAAARLEFMYKTSDAQGRDQYETAGEVIEVTKILYFIVMPRQRDGNRQAQSHMEDRGQDEDEEETGMEEEEEDERERDRWEMEYARNQEEPTQETTTTPTLPRRPDTICTGGRDAPETADSSRPGDRRQGQREERSQTEEHERHRRHDEDNEETDVDGEEEEEQERVTTGHISDHGEPTREPETTTGLQRRPDTIHTGRRDPPEPADRQVRREVLEETASRIDAAIEQHLSAIPPLLRRLCQGSGKGAEQQVIKRTAKERLDDICGTCVSEAQKRTMTKHNRTALAIACANTRPQIIECIAANLWRFQYEKEARQIEWYYRLTPEEQCEEKSLEQSEDTEKTIPVGGDPRHYSRPASVEPSTGDKPQEKGKGSQQRGQEHSRNPRQRSRKRTGWGSYWNNWYSAPMTEHSDGRTMQAPQGTRQMQQSWGHSIVDTAHAAATAACAHTPPMYYHQLGHPCFQQPIGSAEQPPQQLRQQQHPTNYPESLAGMTPARPPQAATQTSTGQGDHNQAQHHNQDLRVWRTEESINPIIQWQTTPEGPHQACSVELQRALWPPIQQMTTQQPHHQELTGLLAAPAPITRDNQMCSMMDGAQTWHDRQAQPQQNVPAAPVAPGEPQESHTLERPKDVIEVLRSLKSQTQDHSAILDNHKQALAEAHECIQELQQQRAQQQEIIKQMQEFAIMQSHNNCNLTTTLECMGKDIRELQELIHHHRNIPTTLETMYAAVRELQAAFSSIDTHRGEVAQYDEYLVEPIPEQADIQEQHQPEAAQTTPQRQEGSPSASRGPAGRMLHDSLLAAWQAVSGRGTTQPNFRTEAAEIRRQVNQHSEPADTAPSKLFDVTNVIKAPATRKAKGRPKGSTTRKTSKLQHRNASKRGSTQAETEQNDGMHPEARPVPQPQSPPETVAYGSQEQQDQQQDQQQNHMDAAPRTRRWTNATEGAAENAEQVLDSEDEMVATAVC